MPEIKKAEVIRYLGYGKDKPDDLTDKIIDEIIDTALKIINPKEAHGVFDLVKNNEGKLYAKGTQLLFEGNDISSHLKGACRCILIACTLGIKAEEMLNLYQKTDMQRAVIFDAVCNAFIESYSDIQTDKLKNQLKKENLYINNRFSPGYGDFDIAKQNDIICSLNCPKAIGLNITDSYTLIPRKSITAVIGVFTSPPLGVARGCECCNLKDNCKMRGADKCLKQTDSI